MEGGLFGFARGDVRAGVGGGRCETNATRGVRGGDEYVKLGVGTPVMARFRSGKHGFRGRVIRVKPGGGGWVYSVAYDNGDFEHGLAQDCSGPLR